VTDLLQQEGMQRTDLYCHDCSKNFIAQLEFSLDGNHTVECPHCGHHHHRVIQNGKVTGERWDSSVRQIKVPRRSVWKADSQPIVTSAASAFIRDRWLKFGLS
jgi:DNA-directed RNA polymerase subunit RPC12/RpoP